MIRVIKNRPKISKLSKKKNPVYISDFDRLDYYFDLYKQMNQLENTLVSVYSNSGIIFGILRSIEKTWPTEASEKSLVKTTYVLKTNFHKDTKADRDNLGLIFEQDESLTNDLFWEQNDDLEKTDFSFVLRNIDKIDTKNNRIYVRKLKQFKGKT